jgi:hypothetical protein
VALLFLVYFEWGKIMHSPIGPSPKPQLSRTLPEAGKQSHFISLLGIWNLEFGIWDLMNAEFYLVLGINRVIFFLLYSLSV